MVRTHFRRKSVCVAQSHLDDGISNNGGCHFHRGNLQMRAHENYGCTTAACVPAYCVLPPPTTLDLRGIKAFSNDYCIYCVHKLSNPAISLWKHRGLRTRQKLSQHFAILSKMPPRDAANKKKQCNLFPVFFFSFLENKKYIFQPEIDIPARPDSIYNETMVGGCEILCSFLNTALNWDKKCPPNRTSLSSAKRNCKSLWWWKSGSFCGGAWIRLAGLAM